MSRVEFDNVWKAYPRWQPGTRSVRSMLSPTLRERRRSAEQRWALQHVGFSVKRGRSLGVIGHNGAGKSTLLRLAAGLTQPTRGTIRVAPNAASVLSLGSTFNAELSGRENALTAAMVSGLRLPVARAALPSIMDFAELQEFEEAPVRSYSDGMRLRLAFGVVAQLRPDLLVLDEVLAVGDLRFQEKCLAHIAELRERGTSVLFASHDLDQIAAECDDAIWMDHGQVRERGEAEDVVERYRSHSTSETTRLTPPAPRGAAPDAAGLVLHENRYGSQELTIEQVRVGGDDATMAFGSTLDIGLVLRAPARRDEDVIVALAVHRDNGDVPSLDVNTERDGVHVGPVGPDGTRVELRIEELELLPGPYVMDVGVFPRNWAYAYDYHWHAYNFMVVGAGDEEQAVFRPRRRRWSVG